MKTVLLIEDTSSILMVYQSLLAREGFTVTSAETAQEGKDAFKTGEFDIVLVDLSLPDGDGLDLLSYFLGKKPTTRAIVVTANGSLNLAVEAIRLGAFDFLVKPVSDTKLLETVNATLDNSSTGSTSKPRHWEQDQSILPSTSSTISSLVGQKLQDVERVFIEETISYCDGSLPKAAEMLGLAPSTLYRKRQNWIN